MRRFALAFAAVLAAGALRAETPVERRLDLNGSVESALQNNQRLLSAKEEIRISEQRVREAQSQYYPQVGLNFSGSRYLAEQNYILPPDFGSILLRPSRGLEPDSFYSGRAWLKQPLYNGGRTHNNVRLSQTNFERARIQFEEVQTDVVFGTKKAFYDVLLREKEIHLYDDAMKSVEDMLRGVPEADPRRRGEIKAIEGRLRRGLAERKRLGEQARLEYLSTLGLELYTGVELQGELAPGRPALDLARLLAWAQESRSEIRRTDFEQEIDRLTVNLSQAERYPVVAFGAVYELNDPKFPLETTQWSATLNVSLPIFDGFSSRARIRQKKARANQSRIQRTEIEDQVNLDVRESFADAAYWTDELAKREPEAKAAAADAERAKDPLDRARSAEWLLEAQQAYWTAVHGQLVALAKLQKAVGRPLGE